MINDDVLLSGLTPNLLGEPIKVFLTFDGRWYRVRTGLETLCKVRDPDRAMKFYEDILI